ncbi:MAG: hypothetical protein KC912_24460 [Proteobacteria bacterium]|nr:hypothetical protein [Pseudomonadota bacterium]
MRPLLALIPLLVLAGCWRQWEREYDDRWAEMADHEADALAAVRGLDAGDLDAVHKAGAGLAREDKVPMLPDGTQLLLDAVRARGKSIESAASLGEAATAVAALSADCHSCHASLSIQTIGRDDATPSEQEWLRLVWQDPKGWDAAEGEAPDFPALREAFAKARTPAEPAAPEEPSPEDAPTEPAPE